MPPVSEPTGRVQAPNAATGDQASTTEPDSARLKEDMAKSEEGSDAALADRESDAEKNVEAVRPDHRENSAGA